jgi:DNA-binding cell septation regulator SpoVG
MAAITISDWKPLRKGALRGFCTATLPSGMVIYEISVLVSNGKPWCSPPSKPMIDRDGRAMLDDAGKRRYSKIIEFTTKDTRDRFSDAVIAALVAAHPEALSD